MEETKQDNPEDHISIPASMLIRLFDQTGGPRGENKGFILFFSNTESAPVCVTNFSNTNVQMALNRFIEKYVDEGTYLEDEN